MAPKDAKKRMKAEQNKKRKLQTILNQLLVKLYQIAHHHSTINVLCTSKYLLVQTIFSTYPRVVISIIVIILVSNQMGTVWYCSTSRPEE
jgi:hypothetical protein